MEALMEALRAAAAEARNRAVLWPMDVEGLSHAKVLKCVLEDFVPPAVVSDLCFTLFTRGIKVGPEILEQQEPTGCDKLVTYLEGLVKPAAASVPLREPPLPVPSSVDWEGAFFRPITENDKYLLSKLDEYADEWDGGAEWQAPFASVVQSSGWGKSRSICELWKDGVFVIYCSMSKRTSTGYPGRSTTAACFDPPTPMSEALVCAYLAASLRVLACSDLSPELWIRSQIENPDKIGGKILVEHRKLLPEMELKAASYLKSAVEAAVRVVHKKRRKDLRMGRGVQIVFAFDEFRGLPDFSRSFPVFRRGLGQLVSNQRLFAVLADTNASVSPHRDEDPTGRSREHGQGRDSTGRNREHGQRLFDPIHLIGRADVFVEPVKTFRYNFKLRRLFLMGRPLWGARWHSSKGSKSVRLEELVWFAVYKLLGGKNPDVELTRRDAAAVFMATIGPEVSSRSHLAHGLVAGHMATCVASLDEGRELVIVHASEAVLAEAGAFLLHKKKFLIPALHILAELLTQGLVLEGVRGELAMKQILLLCMHACCTSRTSRNYIQPVTLRSFLKTLFGPRWDEKKCRKCHLRALVFFNHFVPLSEGVKLTEERLLDFIKHGAAIFYSPGEYASHIGIPWVRLGGDEVGAEVVEAGVFDVHVKFRQNFSRLESDECDRELRLRHQELFPGRARPPVAIVNLGDGCDQMEQNGVATAMLGFSSGMYGFLPDGVVDALKRVLAAKKDVTAGMPPDDIAPMKRMAVLSF